MIFDPEGGFVIGAGLIDSPPGAYSLNPTLVGQARFGFISKYQKGTTVPTGRTQFEFQMADLEFVWKMPRVAVLNEKQVARNHLFTRMFDNTWAVARVPGMDRSRDDTATWGIFQFVSTEYEWLIVAGHRAQFKGTGEINGSGNYGFLLTAKDENLSPSFHLDEFRIKIWDKDDNDTVVYDNRMGEDDGSEPRPPSRKAASSSTPNEERR